LMKTWWIALGLTYAFTALAVSVHLGLLNNLDSTIREWARPHDVWGPAQLRADLVVEGLRPEVLAVFLATVALAYSVKRRSMKPVAFVGGVCVATAAATIVTKVAVGRLNTHGVLGSHGGSFPSGHTIAVVVCLGLCVIVAQPNLRRWAWFVPAFGGGLMGAALLVQAAHWSTDIVGGGLIATGVLAITMASGASHWMHHQSEDDNELAASGGSVKTPELSAPSQDRHVWPG
jgi:membrane-associated phospholipid phosphatase